MNNSTVEKLEREVADLDSKICDERRKIKNKSWGGSLFALNQWVSERERKMSMLRELASEI